MVAVIGAARLALLLAAVVMATSCGSTSSTVEITVHLDQGQSWELRGDPVEGGVVCESGRRQPIGWVDLEGNPLTFEEWVPLLEMAETSNGEAIAFKVIHQYVCADGSGSFTIRELAGPDAATWDIDGGTTAYADLKGSGECDLVTAPVEPGDPPGGMPMRLDCVGSITEESP